MTFKTLSIGQRINSVFKGREFLPTTLQNYPIIMQQVINNINRTPLNIIKELAQIHDSTTKEAIKSARYHSDSNAKNVLLSHIEVKDNNSDEITITAMGDIDAFFEYGVRPHLITPSMESVSGAPVAAWLANRGLHSAVVGGPGSVLRKPGIRMMEQGWKTSARESARVTEEFINTI